LLGAFAKLRKATISFVMSVGLSVRPHGTTRLPLDDLYEILYWRIIRKYIEKIKVSLTSDNNNVLFTRRYKYIYDNISLISSLNEILFRTKVVEGSYK
jgi:hypothetical protein